uniref:Sideroflexin 4 n=1 Tax=Prolemur simus TaxID=1328070 RepID=A0A8C8ZJK4_PROSS
MREHRREDFPRQNSGCARPGAGLRARLLLRARPGGGGGHSSHRVGRGKQEAQGRAASRVRGAAARMEPNVRFWIAERQSFVQRFLQWTELLDPLNLFVSVEKIEKARELLFTNEDASRHALEDQRVCLVRSGVPGSRLGVFAFRSLPQSVFLSMMPAKGMMSAVLPQVSLYAYTTAFNVINGNRRHTPESITLGAGVIASSTFFGVIPYLVQMKYSLDNPWIRRALPVAVLGDAMNVFASRGFEPVRGIEVMDKEGNVIGHSRRAGRKAVHETAISRAVLFGTSALFPEVFTYFFKRTRFFLKNPWSLWAVKLSCTTLAMGLMVPVSFSMFPQIGRIQCRNLEEAIRSSTEETELFYNRGV